MQQRDSRKSSQTGGGSLLFLLELPKHRLHLETVAFCTPLASFPSQSPQAGRPWAPCASGAYATACSLLSQSAVFNSMCLYQGSVFRDAHLSRLRAQWRLSTSWSSLRSRFTGLAGAENLRVVARARGVQVWTTHAFSSSESSLESLPEDFWPIFPSFTVSSWGRRCLDTTQTRGWSRTFARAAVTVFRPRGRERKGS